MAILADQARAWDLRQPLPTHRLPSFRYTNVEFLTAVTAVAFRPGKDELALAYHKSDALMPSSAATLCIVKRHDDDGQWLTSATVAEEVSGSEIVDLRFDENGERLAACLLEPSGRSTTKSYSVEAAQR